MIVKSSRVLTAALCALSLFLLAGQARAQNVPDGFQGHAIIDVSGLTILFNPSGLPPTGTSVLNPTVTSGVVGGGTYTLTLADNAWFRFEGEAVGTQHPIDEVFGFYEVFVDQPGTTAASTNTGWTGDTVSANGAAAYGWKTDPKYTNADSLGLFQPDHTPTVQNLGTIYKAGDQTVLGTFVFNSISDAGPAYFGFHLYTSDNGVFVGGNTGLAYLKAEGGRFVPEPAFYQMAGFLSLGGLGLLKLRRRRKA